MKTLPEQIETDRLLIRVAKPGDGPVFNEAILESIDQLAPWLGWVTPPPTVEDSEQSCLRAHERFSRNEDLMAFFFSAARVTSSAEADFTMPTGTCASLKSVTGGAPAFPVPV